jgi:hypothetical protein
MDLAKLLAYFETSPALRLLRSPNAPFVVDFLHQQFKRAGRITAPLPELHAALAAYREAVRQEHPDALKDTPEAYLAAWCSAETRWLHRSLEAGRDDPVCQLTPHAEDVLAFLDRALGQGSLLGTDSRLRLVVDALDDLAAGTSADPAARLARLRRQKERIEEEIRLAEGNGAVPRYRPAQVRERFATAVSLLKQLQGDFRAVEERFKEIARQVRCRQDEGRDARGDILEYALDAEDLLKRDDAGASFYSFVEFILSPAEQERLQSTARQLARVPELAARGEGLEALRRMVPSLLAEAEKVMRTNQRLSAALRRLLDGRARADRRQVGRQCADILGLAASLADDPPRKTFRAEVETRAGIASPFARTFWSEPPTFTGVDLVEQAGDEGRRAEAFGELARMRRLDWRRMRECVKSATARHGTVTLGSLLEEHPPEAGVIEVLGYLQIAHDDGHIVSPVAEEEVVLPPGNGRGRVLALTLPLVRFVSS